MNATPTDTNRHQINGNRHRIVGNRLPTDGNRSPADVNQPATPPIVPRRTSQR